jgi:aminoglycoside phosphotransferase (APT) family kinase protein
MAGSELSLAREAEVYRALAGSGVRIPHLHAVAPDGSALLVDRAAGTHELGGPAEIIEQVLDDYIDAIADLHTLDPAGMDLPSFRRPVDGPGHAREELDLWEGILRSRTKRDWPLAHWVIRWLRLRAPAQVERTVLCHGDVGPGNFMHEGGKVTALLDWEFSHVGDPMDDLAWWVFRGHDFKGNCGDVAAQLRRWSGRTGLPVDARRVEYYRILVMLRWLVSVAAALDAATGGMDRSVYFGLVPVLSVRLPAAIAAFDSVALGDAPDIRAVRSSAATEIIDTLASDLTTVVIPAVTEPEARRRLAAAELYLSHLKAHDALGRFADEQDRADLSSTIGRPVTPTGTSLGQRGAELVAAGSDAAPYFWRSGLRQAALWPPVAARATAPPTPIPEGLTI